MTNRGMAVMALRLYALVLVAWILMELPVLFLPLVTGIENPAWLIPELAGLGALALLAFWAWFRVGVVVEWLLPVRTAQQADDPQMPTVDVLFHTGLVSAVGLLVIAWALPDLVAESWRYWQASSVGDVPMRPEWFGALAQTLFGTAVLIGRRGLVRLLLLLKHAGR